MLKPTALGILILGMPTLLRSEEVPGRPSKADEKEKLAAWHREALALMKAKGLCGVAIVVPPDAPHRKQLAGFLETLVTRGGPQVQEALLEAVYVCLPAELIQPGKGETAILLDPEGKRVAGGAVGFSSEEGSVNGMDTLLHGEGRLEAQVRAIQDPKIAVASERLGDNRLEDREEAQAYLESHLDQAMPALVKARRESKDPEIQARIEQIVLAGFLAKAGHERQTWLPFGVRWQEEELGDPCPACGMGKVSPRSRRFLSFLAL